MNKFMSSIGLVCLLFSVANAEIISKDGVATDTVTGLMWQDNKDSVEFTLTWEDAKQYCQNSSLGGYNDWRLPHLYELSTLLDSYKNDIPYSVNGLIYIEDGSYWTSEINSNNSKQIDVIPFGYVSSIRKDNTLSSYVRCVRNSISFDEFMNLLNKDKLTISNEIQKNIISEVNGIAYQAASSQNTISAYKTYLKQFPNGEYASSAKSAIDKLTYNSASSQNTISAYKSYLKEYPNGEYASSARSNIQYLEAENSFRALLQSKSPQTMYIEAGKQERNGNTSKANKLYEAIIDRFPNSDFAVKASDKLTGASRAENEASNRRSQSRQECENNKNACLAGCGTYISGADSHNNAVWSCNDKCKQISCY